METHVRSYGSSLGMQSKDNMQSKDSMQSKDNPQDGKDDNTASAAKLLGINCSRCLKGTTKPHQLCLQRDKWLCSECWQKSNQESVSEPAAKRAKLSSFD